MSSSEDVQFLAKLVHRGHLSQEDAKIIFPSLQAGESLDDLLEEELEWPIALIARLRRTDAGEIPEIPGYEILGKLGTGGTADVWRAKEKKTGKIYALKVLQRASILHKPVRGWKGFKVEAAVDCSLYLGVLGVKT